MAKATINDTVSTVYTEVVCCTCNMRYYVPEQWEDNRRESGDGFYCPNGHSLTFGDTQVKRLKRQLESKERALLAANRREENLREDLKTTEAKRRAEKGAKTKMQNRIKKGVCPCCNRHFANLHRHMEQQHPEFAAGKAEV